MNKHKFIEYLHKPGLLTKDSLNELDELISEFPYYQSARALSAKGHRILKANEAGKRVASAAVYSTNRLLLKKYLTSDIYFLSPVVGNESTPLSPEDRPLKPSDRPSVAAPPARETFSDHSETKDPLEAESNGSSIDQIISDLHRDMKELEVSRAKYLEVARKIEEEDAVEQAVKKATSHREQTGSAPKTSPEKKSPLTTKTTGKSTTTAKKPARKTATKSTTTRKSTKTTRSATTKKPVAKKTTATPKAKTTTRKAPAKKTTKKATPGSSKTTKSTTTSKKKDPDLNEQRELINAFIKENPSFSPRSDKINDVDYSEGSSKLHDDFVTEYLAEIYLEQGKNDRAIEIYNSLMLRFPKKRAYFAGLIKKIK